MEYGPYTNSQINSFFRNLNSVFLKNAVDFLLENNIISEEATGANRSYAITEHGIGILTFFKVKPSNEIIKLKS